MEQVRVGIVGMGIGRWNARGLARNPRGAVVALCDLVEERMRDVAKDLPQPVRFFTSYQEMCRDPEIDAVFVGTPNQFHVPVALEAVRNGKHVLVTKPLADSAGAARTLVQAAEAAGVVNMMSLAVRYGPGVRRMGQLAQAGEFGELYYARARSVRRSGIPSWNLGFIQAGGGAFRDMGVHALDSAWWLLGRPQPVSVSGVAGAKFGPRGVGYWGWKPQTPEYAAQYAADDYAGGFVRFENGAGLQIESFWASHQPDEFQIELFGSEAGARLDPLTIYRTESGAPVNTVYPDLVDDAWDQISDHFVACILDGIECQAPLRHGLVVQEMMEALLQSAATGQEVSLRSLQ